MAGSGTPINEEKLCPFCNKGKINITIIPSYHSTCTARAFGKVKRIPVFHPEKITIHNSCEECGKSKKELKEAFEGNTDKLSHKERIERIKKSGLPTQIEF